jgi:hypothetical protein
MHVWQRVRKVLVVCFLLFSLELSDHNRGRAALLPMMVGMMQMAAVMGSDEAHNLLFTLNSWFYK